jgi:hypothetical protein
LLISEPAKFFPAVFLGYPKELAGVEIEFEDNFLNVEKEYIGGSPDKVDKRFWSAFKVFELYFMTISEAPPSIASLVGYTWAAAL